MLLINYLLPLSQEGDDVESVTDMTSLWPSDTCRSVSSRPMLDTTAEEIGDMTLNDKVA